MNQVDKLLRRVLGGDVGDFAQQRQQQVRKVRPEVLDPLGERLRRFHRGGVLREGKAAVSCV